MAADKSEDSDSSGILSFLNRWINDILGLVFPGYLLMLLLVFVFNVFDVVEDAMTNSHPEWFAPALSIGLAYFFGNFLSGFGDRFVFRPLGWLCSWVRDNPADAPKWLKAIGKTFVPESVSSVQALARYVASTGEFQAFRKIAREQNGIEIPDHPDMRDVRMLRSIALSSTPEVNQLTTKFTFHSILNGNVATVVLLFALALLGYGRLWTLGHELDPKMRLFGLLICAVFFYVHALTRYEYYRRSMTTPFSGAVGSAARKQADAVTRPPPAAR